MSLLNNDDDIDIYRILSRTIYFGLFTNILIPMALLLICYYADRNYYVADKTAGQGNMVFIAFGILSLGQAAYALWQRGRRLRPLMVRRMETIENDLIMGLLTALKPIFFTIAAISLYGVLYFYLTGRFQETVFLVFFSFIVFQVVRPHCDGI